jgi:DNA-binding transcriptional LysR family regulator
LCLNATGTSMGYPFEKLENTMYRAKTTIEQWRILQAVVDFGGYAHAALKLNKSQSSLNHAVAKLQDQLNVKLLVVKGRKAFLTPAGEVMLRRSRYLTQNVQDLEELADNINQDWEPEITLAVDLAFPKQLLYPPLQGFFPDCRGSRLKIIDTVLTGTEEAVVQGWADLVITPVVPKGHLGEPLAESVFYPVCHPQHELASLASPIDPNELQQHLQLVIKDTSPTPNEKQGWLKSEQRWTVSSFSTAIDLLTHKIGFCWLPEFTVAQLIEEGSLTRLSIAGSSFRPLIFYIIKPKPDSCGPGSTLLYEQFIVHRQLDE